MRRLSNWWCLVLLLAGLSSSLQAATVYFVDAGIAASGAGTSWPTAKKTLGEAIALAGSGSQIWVRAGTYKPGAARASTFTLAAGVGIYGGFSGSESALSQRVFRTNATILSGEIGSPSDPTDNCYTVVTVSGAGTLDGFIIRDGYANGGAGEGGGMYINGSSPTVQNCAFIKNSCPGFTGGAVSIRGGAPVFRAVAFSGNTGSIGGAVYTNSNPYFENCVFEGNTGTSEGGAVRTSNGGLGITPTWVDCTFSGNAGPGTGGVIRQLGTSAFTNCVFWGNGASPLTTSGPIGTLTNFVSEGGLPGGFTNGGGMQTVDPQFANASDPDGADNIWGSDDDGLMPPPSGTTHDTGTATGAPAVDLRGSTRPRGLHDIGAYERGTIYYVAPVAAGLGNGSSWLNASGDLRAILTIAVAGDEVWVKAGTHKPTATTDRTLAFTVPAMVGVYGGFAGGELLRSARNWTANQTILSGEIGGGTIADNSRHVVELGNNAVIDGFTVRDGYADSTTYSFPHNGGGGIICNGTSPTIRNCAVVNNRGYYGGALVASGYSVPLMQNCIFSGNTSEYAGAAMFIYSSSSAQLQNCTIAANTTLNFGSAISSWSCPNGPVLTDCVVWGNTGGSAMYLNSGTVTSSYSLVQGSGGASWNGTAGTNGGGNLDADPDFRDAADLDGPDDRWMTIDDGIALRGGSPAVNSGIAGVGSDILGRPRPQNGQDMGAYESRGMLYVNPAGTGSGPWIAAGYHSTLPAALAAATSGDEIWVRAGTYVPTAGLSRTASFTVPVGVGVYGGFTGTETLRSQRNWNANLTILSGEIGAGGPADNSRHVVTLANAATLDGFVVRDGSTNSTDFPSFPEYFGAGIFCNGTAPLIRNCVITANGATSGAGAAAVGTAANPTFVNCVFAGNTAVQLGGAAFLINGAKATFRASTVVGNSASLTTGGIFVSGTGTAAVVANGIIYGNTPALGLALNGGGTAAVSYSLIEGSFTTGTWNGLSGSDGGGNIDADPKFLGQSDPDGADNLWMTADDGFRLRGGSPAAETGTAAGAPAGDILNQVRPRGGSHDMGAYEGRCPVAAFALPASTVSETDGTASVPVVLSGIADYPISVPYSTDDGGVPDVTIGTWDTDWYFPLLTNWYDVRTQAIYLKAELGASPKTFRNLTLDVVTVPGSVMNSFTIRMKHTGLSAYSGSGDWQDAFSGWTTVYQGTLSIVSVGPVTLPFTTPFAYDGSSNLLVDISFHNSSGTSAGYVKGYNTGSFRALDGYSFGGAGDPLLWSPSTAQNLQSDSTVPVIVLGTALARGTLTIPAGSSGGSVLVPIINNNVDEDDRVVTITLGTPTTSNPLGAALLGSQGVHTLTITDDDATPTVQVASTASSLGESSADRSVMVTLSAPSGRTVSVDYFTPAGGTTDGSDYSGPASGTLTFPPGQTTQFITRTVSNDAVAEDDEVFLVKLRSPVVNTVLGANTQHAGTIVNDDYIGINFSTYDFNVFEGAEGPGSVQATVQLNSQPAPGATVRLTLASGDVQQVTVSPATIDFTAGDWNVPKTLTVTCVTDAIDDDDHFQYVTALPSIPVGTDAKYAAYGMIYLSTNAYDDDAAGIAVGFPVVNSTALQVSDNGLTVQLPPGTDLSHVTAGSSLVFTGGKPNAGTYGIATVDDGNDRVTLGSAAAPSATWRDRGLGGYWSAIAISDDGTKLAASQYYSGRIHTSTDGGMTWIPRDSNRYWSGIASSSDGTRLVACEEYGLIHTSADSGVTWAATSAPYAPWRAVTSSADGTKLAACGYYGEIWVSADGGVTWSMGGSFSDSWTDVAYSADGSFLVACSDSGSMYRSFNGGTSWLPVPIPGLSFTSVATSSNGQRIIACAAYEQLYVSVNFGASWSTTEGYRNWTGVSSSADGSRLVACASSYDGIVTSSDGGSTWHQSTEFGYWTGVASSADGLHLAASRYYDTLSVSYDVPQAVTILDPISGPVLEGPIVASAASVSGLTVTLTAPPSLVNVKPGMLLTFTGAGDNAGSWRVVSVAGSTVLLESRTPAGIANPAGTTNAQGVIIGDTALTYLKLLSEPTSSVTVGFVSSDASEGTVSPASATILPAAWTTAVPVTLAHHDDDVDDGDKTYALQVGAASSGDGDYAGIDPADIAVTTVDDDTRGVIVSKSSLTVTEGGTADTFTVVLTSKPSGLGGVDVTPVSVSGSTSYTITPASRSFSASNWDVPKTFTVTAVNDTVTEPTEDLLANLRLDFADPNLPHNDYHNFGTPNLDVHVIDNDTPGYVLSVVSPAKLLVPENGSAVVNVRLASQPTSDVVLAVTLVGAPVGVTLGSPTVTILVADWNQDHPVTVVCGDDANLTGESYSLEMDFASGPVNYDLVSLPLVVDCRNVDDDNAGLTITQVDGSLVPDGVTAVAEGGTTDRYQVRLNTTVIPTANFILAQISAGPDVTVSPSTLLWTAATWNNVQVVTVTAVDDSLAEGAEADLITHSIISDDSDTVTGYQLTNPSLSLPTVTVGVTDNDSAGIAVSPSTGLTVTEAGTTATSYVHLLSQPRPVATVTVDSVGGGGSILNVSPSDDLSAITTAMRVTFGGSSPNAGTVAITAFDNTAHTITLATPVVVTTVDQAANIAPVVVIGLAPSSLADGREVDVSPSTLTFDASSWSVNQAVTLAGKPDSIDDGNRSWTVVTTNLTASGEYAGLAVADLVGSTVDIDTVGVVLSRTALTLSENGVDDTYVVSLASLPSANPLDVVTVTINPGQQMTASPSVLTFTSANWNNPTTPDATAHTVTISAIHDFVDQPSLRTATISHSAIGGDYSGIAIGSITASITDHPSDVVGFALGPVGVTTLTLAEAGGSMVGSLRLTSKPLGTVTVTLATGDASVATVTPSTLTFTTDPGGWEVDKTFTVTAVDDQKDTPDRQTTITTTVASGGDSAYNGAALADIAVTLTDNDTAGVVVSGGLTITGLTADSVASATVTFSGAPDLSAVQPGMVLVFTGTTPNAGAYAITAANNTLKTVTLASAPSPTLVDQAAIIYSLLATEAGGTTSFTVRLNSQPSATITVPLLVSDALQGQLSVPSLSFNQTTWSAPQTVTVTGRDLDNVDNGRTGTPFIVNLRKVTISGGTDAAYAGLVTPTDLATDVVADQVILNQRSNAIPTCDQPAALGISEDAPTTVVLTGVGSGQTGEMQNVFVRATSSNPALIPDPQSVATQVRTGTDILTPNVSLPINPAANAFGSAVITVSITDDSSVSGPATELQRSFTVTVSAQDDAPVVSAVGGGVAFAEGDAPVVISPNLAIGDVDNATLTGATITLDTIPNGNLETLAVSAVGLISSWDPVAGVLTISGIQPVSAYQAAVRSLTYSNLSEDPFVGTRIATILVNDGSLPSLAVTVPIAVTSANDAPVIAGAAALAAIAEEDVTNTGTEVADLLVQLTITDVDTGSLGGLAVIATDNSQGVWEWVPDIAQVATVDWAPISATSGSALLLSGATGQRLRFLPGPNFTGTATVTVRAWDQTTGSDASTGNDTTTNGGGTAFSSGSVACTIAVLPDNDPPVIASGSGSMFPIPEDSVGGAGTPMPAMLAGITISDPDAGALRGLAITGLGPNGTWEYSADSGSTWNSLSALAPTATAALVLGDSVSNLVRFVPATDFTGTASFTVVAWDQTAGTNGTQIDTTTGTSCSAGATTVSVSVTPVNDAPVPLAASGNPLTPIIEDVSDPANTGTTVASLIDTLVTDVDIPSAQGIAVIGTTGGGTWQYRTSSVLGWQTLAPDLATARLLSDAGTVMVRYVPGANENGSFGLAYHLWDRTTGTNGGTVDLSGGGATGTTTAYSIASMTSTITVTAVNDVPAITITPPGAITGAEGTAIPFTFTSSVSDVDALSGLETVTITTANGVLGGFTVAGGITPTGNGTGTITASGTIGSLGTWLGAQTTAAFTPGTNVSGGQSVTFTINDGGNTPGPAEQASTAITITVGASNDPPVLAGAGNALPSINEDVAVNPGMAIDDLVLGSVIITDVDNVQRGVAVDDVTLTGALGGNWQYSVNGGGLWTTVTTVDLAGTNHLLLRADGAGQNRIRYAPATDRNGSATVIFHAWDTSAGGNATIVAVSGAGSGTSPYSSASLTSTVTVNPVNDAPVLSAPVVATVRTGNPLQPITEDPGTNPGTTVASLITGWVSDVDGIGAAQGIAVTGSTGNGTWWYSINSGLGWNAIGAPSDTAALLLSDAGTTLVRFVPALHWNGTASLTYRAWDRTSGSNGLSPVAVNGVNNGGITAISALDATSFLTVSPVNDAPDIAVALTAASGNEDTAITATFTATLTDVDADPTAIQLVITAQNGTVAGFSTGGGVTVANDGTATVTATGLVGNLQTWLIAAGASGSVQFTPDPNVNGTRQLTFTIDDQGSTGTGGALQDSSSLNVTIVPTNDPPALAGVANPFPALPEDVANTTVADPGMTIDALVGGTVTITDIDNVQRGVAVVSTTQGAGAWQYCVDGGAGVPSWIALPTLGGNGFVLAADGAGLNRLRYLPDTDENGAPAASVTYRAWDRSDALVDATLNSVAGAGTGTSSFSSATATSSIAVTAVNDAPSLNSAATFLPVDEDSKMHAGETVESLVLTHMTDVDGSAQQGIAVTAVDNTNGAWQYSLDNGSTWIAFGNLASGATVLHSQNVATRVRFVPSDDLSVAATITYRGWDRSDGWANGQTGVDASVTGGTSAFSSSQRIGTVTVNPVNDAPVIVGPSGTPADYDVAEDDVANPGIAVDAVIAGLVITDADPSALGGMAIVGVDNANGTWQYKAGAGAWTTIPGGIANSSARLLTTGSSSLVRFLPNQDFTGMASLTLRAWDRTDAVANGGTDDAGSNGGTEAFSSATAVLLVEVNAANDAPTVDLNLPDTSSVDMSTPATYVEGAPPQQVTIAGLAVSDPDSAMLTGGTIVMTTHPDGAAETLAVSTAVPGVTGTWDQSTWTMTLSGTAGVAQYQQILGSLTYINSSEDPDSSARGITVILSDGTASSPAATALVQVQPVNDAPVLVVGRPDAIPLGSTLVVRGADGSGATATAVLAGDLVSGFVLGSGGSGYANAPRVFLVGGGGTGAAAIASITAGQVTGLTVTAPGSGYVSAPTVIILPDALILSAIDVDDPPSSLRFTVRLRPTLGDLVLTGTPLASNTGIFADSDLDGVRLAYVHGGLLAGTDGFAIEVDDQQGGSTIQVISIVIQGLVPPQLNIDDASPLAWTEGAAAVQLDGGATITDTDSADFGGGSITVSPSTAFPGDVIALSPVLLGGKSLALSGTQLLLGATPVGSVVSSGLDGQDLTISLQGTCTPAIAQDIVQCLTWSNTGDDPAADPEAVEARSLTITINDGSNDSLARPRTILVDPVDDAPVVAPYTVSLTPGLKVSGQIIATDPENEAVSFALGAPPVYGTLVFNADGSFTYQHTALDEVDDGFDIIVTDSSAGTVKTSTATIDVVITQADPLILHFTSVAPVRAAAGLPFIYVPTVAGTANPVDYSLVPVLTEAVSGNILLPTVDYLFDPSDGSLQITTPVAPGDGSGYYRTGILAVDRVTHQSAYQPILIKIHAGGPTG